MGRPPGSPSKPGETPADPVHVLRTHFAEDPPGAYVYQLGRWSLVSRLAADAASSGTGDELTDLGPDALDTARLLGPEDIAPGILLRVGVAVGWQWKSWDPPVPPEPVPGSPQWRAARN